MKIEIDYNGIFAVCRIEPMDEPGKMVNFNDADTNSQTYALSAFRRIDEYWRLKTRFKRYKKLPVMHIRQEFQITTLNFDKIQKLAEEGVILTCSYDVSRAPTISVTLKDGHTIVKTNGWLMQDTEGRWWGMDNGYHRMLEQYQKIVIEK